MKIGKFPNVRQTTASLTTLYERRVEKAKASGASISILCKQKGPRDLSQPENGYTSRPGIVLVDGQVRKEWQICGYPPREHNGMDYYWGSALYSADGRQTGTVSYNYNNTLITSFRDPSGKPYYNIKWYKSWGRWGEEGTAPLIYTASSYLDAEVSSNQPLGLKYHLDVNPRFVQKLGIALFDLDFVPPELTELLAAIVKDKKPYQKHPAPYKALYEYLLGEQAQRYL